jgi:hypothetical protein
MLTVVAAMRGRCLMIARSCQGAVRRNAGDASVCSGERHPARRRLHDQRQKEQQ